MTVVAAAAVVAAAEEAHTVTLTGVRAMIAAGSFHIGVTGIIAVTSCGGSSRHICSYFDLNRRPDRIKTAVFRTEWNGQTGMAYMLLMMIATLKVLLMVVLPSQ